MKKFKLLVVALAVCSFTAIYGCGDGKKPATGGEDTTKTVAPEKEDTHKEESHTDGHEHHEGDSTKESH